MAFKIGDQVKVKHTDLSGPIEGAKLDEVNLEIQYMVRFVDFNGEEQTRYFLPDMIEAA